jgi:hypothetical protein
MAASPGFHVAEAHKFFAAHCFNAAWDLIDKAERTPADDRLMVALNQASIYHWLNREDCKDENLSIGYWQASRIQSLLGNASEALRQAEICLGYSAGLKPFFVGYAYEALARGASLAGDRVKAATYLSIAMAHAERVESAEERALLMQDLARIDQ